MSLSSRSFTRASIVAVGALALAACGDSTTAPLQVTPDQLQSVGESVATELEGAMSSLTAQDVMNSNGGAPTFSRVPRAATTMFRGLSLNRYAVSKSTATDISQCGVASQTPPVDTDGDQVPDNFSVTFALPACTFTDATNTYNVTGVLRISDPQPGTPGMALNYGLETFKVTFSGADGSGYLSRDGSGSVSVSATGLSQTVNWTDNFVLTGITSAGDVIHWAATFAAAQGQSIVAGRSLPDGVYQPNGSVTVNQDRRAASFSVTTIDPLQYSASCAAGVAAGTSLTPFTSGRVRVALTNQQSSASVDVTYSSCNSATVTLVSQ